MMLKTLDETNLLPLLEALLLAAGKPLREEDILALFSEEERPSKILLKQTLKQLQDSCENRGFRLVEIASGYQFQINSEWAPWVSRLWEEKAPRYSRALLETLALIAYRQPVTRGEIEDIRGVSISQSIFKTLLEERDWIRVVGHREVPGKPALYATTKQFLDYFGLKTLEELPSLPEIMNLEDASEIQDEKVEKFIQMALIDNAGEAMDLREDAENNEHNENKTNDHPDTLHINSENNFETEIEANERMASNEILELTLDAIEESFDTSEFLEETEETDIEIEESISLENVFSDEEEYEDIEDNEEAIELVDFDEELEEDEIETKK